MNELRIPENAAEVKPLAVGLTLTVGFFTEAGDSVGLVNLQCDPAHHPFGVSLEERVTAIVAAIKQKIAETTTPAAVAGDHIEASDDHDTRRAGRPDRQQEKGRKDDG